MSGSRSPLTVAEEIRLITGAKHGDHGNFETLVELYMGRAIGVAMGYVGNRDDAIDMAQDAFYRVYKHLDRFREGETSERPSRQASRMNPGVGSLGSPVPKS